MTVRKNQANLTAAEKKAFTDAVVEVKRRGVYDEFVTMHRTRFIQDMNPAHIRTGHNTPSFLPWHRQYLIAFERELQKVQWGVSIPYWDWTTARSRTASPWTPDLLGGAGRDGDSQVMDGPFAHSTGNWPITVQTDTHPFLRRTLGGTYPLPLQSDVDQAMAQSTYDAPPWDESAPGFRNTLEGNQGAWLHNQVHIWVGGQMAQPVSPNDPVFWLHHAFVDKLWADWQRRYPGSSAYLPTGNTAGVVDLNEPMAPWDSGPNPVTPAHMLDHTRYYTYA